MKPMEKGNERSLQAFNAFRRAIEEGDTGAFEALVTSDFGFIVPIPFEEWQGEQKGTERFRELVELERASMSAKLTPVICVEQEDTGIVIFQAEGIFNEMPYTNELVIVFRFEQERIRSFREYVGVTSHLLAIAKS
ncbi:MULTISPECIES: nuclear transport factor 2 family protein [Paenibacillus]|uniref:nuclear transport factor 2 family protein n=1 Tax=Paenibacillus TaxID=44249 RepID=UPI0021F12A61|nr:nuclear transport factor 2 family protein [Paenibacillus sp. PSB04]